jgi:hypothetical protein
MTEKPTTTEQPLAHDLTEQDIQRLIRAREREGATCKVVTKNNRRFLVCQWPSP